MEVYALWKMIVRRWWLVALPALAAFIFALAVYIQSPPRGGYATQIRFAAAPPPGVTVVTDEDVPLGYIESRYYPWKAGEFVVDGFAGWVPSTSFAEEVSNMLANDGITLAPRSLYGHIAADNERSVLTVYLDWDDPGELETIAEAAVEVVRVRHVDYFPQLAPQGASVSVLDEVIVRPKPPSLGQRLDPFIRFGLGLALGLALALVVDYIDPTIRDRQEVETIGLPVLAEIPRHK